MAKKPRTVRTLLRHSFKTLPLAEKRVLWRYWGRKGGLATARKRRAEKRAQRALERLAERLERRAVKVIKGRKPAKKPVKKPFKKIDSVTAGELQQKPWKSLSSEEKKSLQSYWGRRGRKKQIREDDIFSQDFAEILIIVRKLRELLEQKTGLTWDIKRKGPEWKQKCELVIREEGQTIHPAVMAELMDKINPEILSVVPKMLVMGHIIDAEGDKRWYTVALASDGHISWSHAIASFDVLPDSRYRATDLMAISFTWFDETPFDRMQNANRRRF